MAPPKKNKPGAGGKESAGKKYKHKHPRLVFHLPRSWVDAFRRYVKSIPTPRPNESEHLRAAFQEYLEKRGVELPPAP